MSSRNRGGVFDHSHGRPNMDGSSNDDFAVAEADISDAGGAHDVQIGRLGDLRVVATR